MCGFQSFAANCKVFLWFGLHLHLNCGLASLDSGQEARGGKNRNGARRFAGFGIR